MPNRLHEELNHCPFGKESKINSRSQQQRFVTREAFDAILSWPDVFGRNLRRVAHQLAQSSKSPGLITIDQLHAAVEPAMQQTVQDIAAQFKREMQDFNDAA